MDLLNAQTKIEMKLNSDPVQKCKQKLIFWRLPYKSSAKFLISHCLKRIQQKLSFKVLIKVAYSTSKTSLFFRNKDALSQDVLSHIVYKFECRHCNSAYIGETVRHLSTRVNEHITGKPTPSVVSLHCHAIQKEDFKVIHRSLFTKIAESIILNNYKSSKTVILLNDMQSSVPLKLF